MKSIKELEIDIIEAEEAIEMENNPEMIQFWEEEIKDTKALIDEIQWALHMVPAVTK